MMIPFTRERATALFHDRHDAGRHLAGRLRAFANRPDTLVLALPRGGVPVGYEVATALNLPLDVIVVRKLGVPGHEELAMGAIASGGARVLNQDLVRSLHLRPETIEAITNAERRELERRQRLYRDDQPPPAIRGRTVVLVDDGLATGSTMRAAVLALRADGAARIVVAVPVAAAATCAELRQVADEVICAETPEPFYAVGLWYEEFDQTSDEEVRRLLAEAAARRASSPPMPGGADEPHAENADAPGQ